MLSTSLHVTSIWNKWCELLYFSCESETLSLSSDIFSPKSFAFSEGFIADNLKLNAVTWSAVFKDLSYMGFKIHTRN